MTPPKTLFFTAKRRPPAGSRFLLFLACLCLALPRLSAQDKPVQGTVIARSSGEKIALASVVWQSNGRGCVTDSLGGFHIARSSQADTLLISCVGYASMSIPVGPTDTAWLNIQLSEKQSADLVVKAKYNRGLFWWKRIVRRKPVNNPYTFNTYSCRLYKKLELDLNNITRESLQKTKLLRPFGFVADNIDTTSANSSFLPVFMKESLSQYYYSSHPRKKREEITAIRSSGLNNTGSLQVLENMEQNINIYDDYITLFGKEFISPLSNSGDAHYDYRGADTQYIDGQRYLHLFFSPKNPGENAFNGDCWIHQPTWAIRSIRLEISPTADINFVHRLSISQEFNKYTDSTFILGKDQLIADISPLQKNKLSLIARQTRIYNQPSIDDPATAATLLKNVSPEQTLLPPDGQLLPAEFWDSSRPEPLSVNEQNAYRLVDTLTAMPLFQSYLHTLEFIVGGRKSLGKWEIGPWYKWISSNKHEGLRLRFDLATTEAFSKQLWLHGYIAYGAADQQFKGAFESRYKIPGNGGYTLQASYLRDLDNGKVRNEDEGVSTDNLFSQLIRRPGIMQKFIMVEQVKTGLAKQWNPDLSTGLVLSHTGFTTFNPLPPIKMIARNPDAKQILTTELGLRIRYAPGERRITTAHRELRLSGDHPVFETGFTMGLPGIAGSQYSYRKMQTTVTQNLRLPGWGQVHYQLYGGRIWGDALPFMLLEIHPGNETFYYAKQAFNLMSRYEYVSDRYAGFSIEHDFEKKLLNLLPLVRRLKVRQFWNCKAVWGDLSPADKKLNRWEYKSYHMRSLNGHPYVELGTGLDNIFKYLRLDCVWRFAPASPYRNPNPTHPHPYVASSFGVFASAHIQF